MNLNPECHLWDVSGTSGIVPKDISRSPAVYIKQVSCLQNNDGTGKNRHFHPKGKNRGDKRKTTAPSSSTIQQGKLHEVLHLQIIFGYSGAVTGVLGFRVASLSCWLSWMQPHILLSLVVVWYCVSLAMKLKCQDAPPVCVCHSMPRAKPLEFYLLKSVC